MFDLAADAGPGRQFDLPGAVGMGEGIAVEVDRQRRAGYPRGRRLQRATIPIPIPEAPPVW